MTIPASLDPAGSDPYELTCPDSEKTFKDQGALTSAQYYVNPKGTPLEKACTWGDGGKTGNWAPVVRLPSIFCCFPPYSPLSFRTTLVTRWRRVT